ncbi:MAG: hypothetical protein ACC619_03885 [Paracoccaceae bacterium]
MTDKSLTKEEIDGLREVEKPLSRRLDPDVRESLLAKGLIETLLGGLGVTAKGRDWLMRNC